MKVKAQQKVKRMEGKCISAFTVYGYKKNPEDKNNKRLISRKNKNQTTCSRRGINRTAAAGPSKRQIQGQSGEKQRHTYFHTLQGKIKLFCPDRMGYPQQSAEKPDPHFPGSSFPSLCVPAPGGLFSLSLSVSAPGVF